LIARAKRFAMYVVDGVVQVYAPEVGTGACDLSGGEALLEQI
jgi:cytochrome c peroxidase